MPRRCPTCGRPVCQRRKYCSRVCIALARVDTALVTPPTPAQIAARARRIRARWSEEQHRRRARSDWRPAPWSVPVCSLAEPSLCVQDSP